MNEIQRTNTMRLTQEFNERFFQRNNKKYRNYRPHHYFGRYQKLSDIDRHPIESVGKSNPGRKTKSHKGV